MNLMGLSANLMPLSGAPQSFSRSTSDATAEDFDQLLLQNNLEVQNEEELASLLAASGFVPPQVISSSGYLAVDPQASNEQASTGHASIAQVSTAQGSPTQQADSLIKSESSPVERRLRAGQNRPGSAPISREQVMSAFLNRLQADFGIQPQQVIRSFQSMSPAELSMPAEKSARLFASGLGARPEHLPMVENLYLEMVDLTGQSLLAEEINGASESGRPLAGIEVISEADLRRQKLEQSLSQMADDFFQSQSKSQPNADGKQTSDKMVAPLLSGVTGSVVQDKARPHSTQASPIKSASQSGRSSFEILEQTVKGMLQDRPAESQTQSNDSQMQSEPGQNPFEQNQIAFEQSQMPTLASVEAQQRPFDESIDLKAIGTVASNPALMKEAPDVESHQNARDLVAQARVLAQAGGGEVKMALKPEGLGEVTLKVRVIDGQVSVQMTANTDHAKKLIESGIEELRSGLASQHLQVEALKIDSAKDLQNSQMDFGSNREEARQMAQDFMSSFRQDRESFRQGLFDGGMGFRGYRQQSDDRRRYPSFDSVEQTGKGQSVAGQARTDSTRRLDLVA